MYIEDDDDLIAMLSQKPAPCPKLERIYEIEANYNKSFELINRYERGNCFNALGFRAGQWFETTQDVYWYFLECLPPLYQTSGGFIVGECTMNGLYDCFLEIDGKYYCAVVEWAGPKSFAALWTALLAEVAS